MKNSTMFIIFGVIICLIALIVVYRVEVSVATTLQPRYDCEDNSDTTKGNYKGVLTHCVPVEITRTM